MDFRYLNHYAAGNAPDYTIRIFFMDDKGEQHMFEIPASTILDISKFLEIEYHKEEENSPPEIPDYLKMKEDLDGWRTAQQAYLTAPEKDNNKVSLKLVSKTGSTIERDFFSHNWYWFTGPLAGEPVDALHLEAKVWRVL